MMTPWIVAHKFWHALDYSFPKTQNTNEKINNLIKDFARSYGIRSSYTNNWFRLCHILFSFKTARDWDLSLNPDEIVGELIAQYLIQGKVTLNSYDIIVDKLKRKTMKPSKQSVMDLENNINAAITELLDLVVGEIVVD